MFQHKTYILFDLDGTLTDPKLGITRSVQYALRQLGIEEPNVDKLEPFIGPPLQESFPLYYEMDEAATKRAIHHYREYFKDKGLYENEVYVGIRSLLATLTEHDRTLIVATSKPTVFAEQIIDHFQLRPFFQEVVGSELDGTRSNKADIISFILNKHPHIAPSQFVMIGDRKHDIIGAVHNGIASIGVTYGYGSATELLEAKADLLANSVQELQDLFVPVV
ncbi:HAD family hydrolase [Paenibacillus sp. 481]|uniref:HAD family hydrolase n=1 Tax=Paenibacillus sp. 481 TaxID=2835869 RepID=UPI001E2FA025|nr:HAD family hydrolase [Paenibacillus sp. 481]UHA72180.1 HAD family hydrolase [Paenibacillus sp. 481]